MNPRGVHFELRPTPHGRIVPQREREMFLLRVLDGWTLKEIADQFGLKTPERVRQLLSHYCGLTGVPPAVLVRRGDRRGLTGGAQHLSPTRRLPRSPLESVQRIIVLQALHPTKLRRRALTRLEPELVSTATKQLTREHVMVRRGDQLLPSPCTRQLHELGLLDG